MGKYAETRHIQYAQIILKNIKIGCYAGVFLFFIIDYTK